MNIRCNNCGLIGHTFKECKNPITSYGIILYRFIEDKPHILMIQRKDSLCYIEFLRGKYKTNNLQYIQILINKFNMKEKENIVKYSFDELWKRMWLIEDINKSKFKSDYEKGKANFDTLKKGYQYNDKFINIDYFVNKSPTEYITPEWEFPKGRRNNNETNKDCAIRECKEETNYTIDDYELIINIRPFSENYMGENKIKYRHLYYLGRLLNEDKVLEIDPGNKDQIFEISGIKWLDKESSLSILRDYHKTRETVILNVFSLLENINDFHII